MGPSFRIQSAPAVHLAHEIPLGADSVVLEQVGTSESIEGRLVVRAELRG